MPLNSPRSKRWLAGLFVCWCGLALAAATPEELLQQLDAYPHSRQISQSQQEVVDYEVGLGAMQKVRGEWRFKHSERLSGTLVRYTWQIVDGFSSAEVMREFLEPLVSEEGTELLFTCDGRACGRGAEWANRVFGERQLYGREDLQRYRVYSLQGERNYRLVAYSSERTEDRQYLHVELLLIAR
ncbi:MAG: DUF4892 domain-containing protein [Halioglobus sp.]